MGSKDKRTKRQKLQDMAQQSASPHEAEIAKQKLSELPEEDVVKDGETFSFSIKVDYYDSPYGNDPLDGIWILVGDKFVKI